MACCCSSKSAKLSGWPAASPATLAPLRHQEGPLGHRHLVAQLLESLALLDPGGDRLAQGDRDMQRARRPLFLPGQHRGLVERAGLDTAAGGLATAFGGDR